MLLLAVVTLEASRASGGGPGPAPCPQPLTARIPKVCHDGDPRCDVDGACDGRCLVPICLAIPDPCRLPSVSMCPTGRNPYAIEYVHAGETHLLQLGEAARRTNVLLAVRCRPSRDRACEPPPPTCQLTIAPTDPGIPGFSVPCRSAAFQYNYRLHRVATKLELHSLDPNHELTVHFALWTPPAEPPIQLIRTGSEVGPDWSLYVSAPGPLLSSGPLDPIRAEIDSWRRVRGSLRRGVHGRIDGFVESLQRYRVTAEF